MVASAHDPDWEPTDPRQDDDEAAAPLFLEDWESDVYDGGVDL